MTVSHAFNEQLSAGGVQQRPDRLRPEETFTQTGGQRQGVPGVHVDGGQVRC